MDNADDKLRIKKINHVGVPISDRKRALAFFRDIIGLKLIPSMVDAGNIIWLQTEDGPMVHLIEPSSRAGIGAGWHIALEVEDFDNALRILDKQGCSLADGPGRRHDGQHYAFLIDPDGNRIEICSASFQKPTRRVVDEMGKTTALREKKRNTQPESE